MVHLYIYGIHESTDFQKARAIGEELSNQGLAQVLTEGMFESDYHSLLLSLKESVGGEFMLHTDDVVIYTASKSYIGGLSNFEIYARSTFSFKLNKPSQAFEKEAYRQKLLAYALSNNIFTHMTIDIKGQEHEIIFELFHEICRHTSKNFVHLCIGDKKSKMFERLSYENSQFHRIVPNTYIMGGIMEGDRRDSIYGGCFKDECFEIKHDKPGFLCMANSGPNTNTSLFYITLRELPFLNNKHVVFGRVVKGMKTVWEIANQPCVNQRPVEPCVIKSCGIYPTPEMLADLTEQEKIIFRNNFYSTVDPHYMIREIGLDTPLKLIRENTYKNYRDKSGGMYSLINRPLSNIRKTKIICTIGPSSREVEIIIRLIDAGMNIARVHLAQGVSQDHVQLVRNIKQAMNRRPEKQCSLLIDTRGSEVRTGMMEDHKPVTVRSGLFSIYLRNDILGNDQGVGCNDPHLLSRLRVGDKLLLADGNIDAIVHELKDSEIVLNIQSEGMLRDGMSIIIPEHLLPPITEHDKEDIIRFAIHENADYLGISYCNNAETVMKVKRLIKKHGKKTRVIGKIENIEAIQHIDEILEVADGITIARGNLGVYLPPEKVFLAQKMIIQKCNVKGKPVIVSTQILESIVLNSEPTRAEISDAANVVLDGGDAMLLTAETAVGQYPLEAIQYLHRICLGAESHKKPWALYEKIYSMTPINQISKREAVCAAAVRSAMERKAAMIYCVTESGYSANMICKYRPTTPVLAFTPDFTLSRQLSLLRGCIGVYAAHILDPETMLDIVVDEGRRRGYIASGDTIIGVFGRQGKDGLKAEVMQIHNVNE